MNNSLPSGSSSSSLQAEIPAPAIEQEAIAAILSYRHYLDAAQRLFEGVNCPSMTRESGTSAQNIEVPQKNSTSASGS